jgi:hypothetical protein
MVLEAYLIQFNQKHVRNMRLTAAYKIPAELPFYPFYLCQQDWRIFSYFTVSVSDLYSLSPDPDLAF